MRRWLRDKKHGIFRVLHSAAAHAWRVQWDDEKKKVYEGAYAYLQKRMEFMEYSRYRRCGLAIGSGITEAACKMLFTQRFKQSGMKWSWEEGQKIVELRTIWLSGVWDEVYTTYLKQLPQAKTGTKCAVGENQHEMAA